MLHSRTEVVPGNAILPAQALQLCSSFESPQDGADSATSKSRAASWLPATLNNSTPRPHGPRPGSGRVDRRRSFSCMRHIVDIVLPARAVGKGLLPFHTQGLCSSYSSLTRSYRWPISGQEQPGCGLDLKGSRRLNPPCPVTVPTWDLPTVLRALKGPHFEPLQSADLRSLMLKTTLLLALASVKCMGDLQALSVITYSP